MLYLFMATPVAYGSSWVGVKLELELPAYATATAMPDQSGIFHLHHSSWQQEIFNALSKARDRTCNLMARSWIISAAPCRELQGF